MSALEVAVGQEWSGAQGTIRIKDQYPHGTWLVTDPVYDEEIVMSSETLAAWIKHSKAKVIKAEHAK